MGKKLPCLIALPETSQIHFPDEGKNPKNQQLRSAKNGAGNREFRQNSPIGAGKQAASIRR